MYIKKGPHVVFGERKLFVGRLLTQKGVHVSFFPYVCCVVFYLGLCIGVSF